MTPDNEFAYNPALHLTRLLADRLRGLLQPARQRFGERPLTALWESARNLIAMDEAIAQDRQALTTFANDLFAALADIATRLTINHPSLCGTYGFFELAARVWRESVGDDHEQKAGYALKHHESNRLIFLFEPNGADDRVPFDLHTFKYVPITQAAEIPNRLTPELESILQSAGALLAGGGA